MKQERKTIRKLFNELTRAELHAFPSPRKKLEAPDRQGVYVIYSPRVKVLHVGQTPRGKKGISQRLYDHLCTRSSFTIKYMKKKGYLLRNGYKFRCVPVKNPRVRALLESYATGQLCPAHIGLGQLTKD